MVEPGIPDLRRSSGAAALARDVVVVQGPDAVTFLQGQLSQDVVALPVGASAPSLLLQPTGKVDAWLRVTRLAEDEVLLDVDEGGGEAVSSRLRRFLLRTKATLAPARWTGVALRGPGSGELAVEGGHRLGVRWPGAEGLDVLGPDGVAVSAPLVPPSALEALRIVSGVPAMGAEITDATIPAELGQWLIDASVSFSKGCYTGQELVARIDSRGGNVPRPVRGLRLADAVAAVGSVLTLDGREVGRVTSSASAPGMGPVALATVARAVAPGAVVEVAGADGAQLATVVEPPL
jgi:folate-binding protein YgfZ